jgi:hypothetical protein
MTTILKRKSTPIPGIQRTLRRVLASNPGRRWYMSDFMQAVDPTGRYSPASVRSRIVEAMPLVVRQLGVKVFKDGRRNINAYVLPERTVPDNAREPHIEPAPTQLETVIQLLEDEPRIWRTAEIEARVFASESQEQRRRHSSFYAVVTKAAQRLGWGIVQDPFDSRYRVIGPRPV